MNIDKSNKDQMSVHLILKGKEYAAKVYFNQDTPQKNLGIFKLFTHSCLRRFEKQYLEEERN